MKKISFYLLFIVLGISQQSCDVNDYLDKIPEAGLGKEEVFSTYENFVDYLDGIYNGEYYYFSRPNLEPKNWKQYSLRTSFPMYYAMDNQRKTWDTFTEIMDNSWAPEPCHTLKQGKFMPYSWLYTNYANYVPILKAMFMVIRRCNMVLENISMLQNVSQDVIDDFKGQAYFARGLAHFELFRTWGRMPYITKVIGPDDEWDLKRLTAYETCFNAALDMDTAFMYFQKANVIRRDNPVPGAPGHLDNPNMFRPNGCAAKAYKGRILLYAASPLNNDKGQKAWEDAAKANWEAIQTALQNGYELLPFGQRTLNFVGAPYTNEKIWAWYPGTTYAWNSATISWITNGIFQSSTTGRSANPTQNAIDKYETKWGESLITDQDKQNAIGLGHYNPQNPYIDRDPRFYQDIIYNTATIPGYGTAKIYRENVGGKDQYSELLNPAYRVSRSGYYVRKIWSGASAKIKNTTIVSDPLMRLAELYLNYAEAANEAYGPNTPAPGASLSAVQAINIIRERATQVPVRSEFTQNTTSFRDRVKNERIIELFYEGNHYYWDSRRWKDAPIGMTSTLMGMDIEKLAAGYDKNMYPTGYRYNVLPLSSDRQTVWKDAMYYFCFETEDVQKMKNFEPNEVW